MVALVERLQQVAAANLSQTCHLAVQRLAPRSLRARLLPWLGLSRLSPHRRQKLQLLLQLPFFQLQGFRGIMRSPRRALKLRLHQSTPRMLPR